MKFFGKTVGLVLASLALASCGGSGSNGGAFSPPPSGTITLNATTTTLPTNTGSYLPHDHGPNQAEVTITLRNADGTLLVGHDVQVAISPVQVAAISVLDDGTAHIDDLWGTYPIKGTNGVATAWVNAGSVAGTAVFTASAVDPTTNRTISASLTFHIVTGVGAAPASVSLVASPTGVYLPGSGGSSTSLIRATVLDGGGQFVADPVSGNSGVDNIKFEIIGNAGDATLSTSSTTGPVSGTSVTSHTVHGVATATFQAGPNTPQGPVQIRVTVDRADNNVSNGIQDPVTSTISVIVSDGKLYSIELTSPLFAPGLPGSITINPVSTGVTSTVTTIPADPDATLSLTVSALATDRQGNPVIPGTAIRFGSVDEPVGAPGTALDNQFLLSGTDGNPQEGGSLFTAPTGHFTTGGGGAGPGDALVVFGKAVQGNTDLESAVTVQHVNSATSLTVAPNFNLNDTTGVSVDYGPVLPYLIGRSEHGNITASSTTNALGIAHAVLTYTVNSVGDAVAVWAQGDGIDRVTNGPRRVTDAGTLVYPGVAPATITAFPNPILGDKTQQVTVCVVDALGIPLRGVQIGFQMTLPSGTGSVDGTAGSGFLSHLTGINGCAIATVVTSGLPVTLAGGNSGQIVFTGAGATSNPIDIIVELGALQAFPSSVVISCAGTQTQQVTIVARGVDGSALPGVTVNATCSATNGSLSADPASGVTGSDGSFTFNITATGFLGGMAVGSGQCVFSATGDTTRTVTVPFKGNASAPSPAPVCGP